MAGIGHAVMSKISEVFVFREFTFSLGHIDSKSVHK